MNGWLISASPLRRGRRTPWTGVWEFVRTPIRRFARRFGWSRTSPSSAGGNTSIPGQPVVQSKGRNNAWSCFRHGAVDLRDRKDGAGML